MKAKLRVAALVAASAEVFLPSAAAGTPDAGLPPPNPYLAASHYPIGHTNSAQVDSTAVAGPTGPSHALAPGEIEYALTGPGHLGNFVSPPYAGGRRVIWTNGPRDIVKLDYATLRVLARQPLAGYAPFGPEDADRMEHELQTRGRLSRLKFAFDNIRQMLPMDLSTVYCLLDRDGRFYAGGPGGFTVYGDARPGDPDSPIAVVGHWKMPKEVTGSLVGMNMTYDGWIVVATDTGFVVTVSRDLSQSRWLALPHSDEAAAYNARMAKQKRTGYNWIRNAVAVDDAGGIYAVANGWMEKVVWNGRELSARPADGAWAEPYPNGTGTGSGSTPVLLGFGKADRLVAITDGEPLMHLTLYWRDAIPAGWPAPAGAPSPRVAGRLPVTMGDASRTTLQSEQAVVVAGDDMIVVNNEPATLPWYLPSRIKGLLISLLGDDPVYTPHGMEKYRWDPQHRTLVRAWANPGVSSPNCVPYASLGSGRVYTVGVVDGQWTLESVALDTGASAERWTLGGPRYNTMFSGVTIDPEGRVVYGGMFGLVRLSPRR